MLWQCHAKRHCLMFMRSHMKRLAHKSEDGRYQTIAEHLEGTARLAGQFAAAFDAQQTAELAGMLHDIGKYSDAFQKRLLNGGIKVDHSTAGAQAAYQRKNFYAAFAIAGHHAGLPDGGNRNDSADEGTLFGRLKRIVDECAGWQKEITLPSAELPAWLRQSKSPLTHDFFIRMLYSCLVDADFIDTETFMNNTPAPRGTGAPLSVLVKKVRQKAQEYLSCSEVSEVVQLRNQVLRACIERGRDGGHGLYSLTVPTGGGKTFSSLAFAMEHAAAQHMERIVYVIPYTSIIDQTVQVFSALLGEENVLAHYAGTEYRLKDEESLSPQQYRQLLASENWDAPIVVTTAVQFFESIYANRSSKCRKLHNLAGSVIIFDEAQTLPNDYLKPCISAIAQLVSHYHATAVLCTATQPALDDIFREFIPQCAISEVFPHTAHLYQALRRTTLRELGCISTDALCERLSEATQVLCVVNLRKTAKEIFERLPNEGSYCLTTLLCAADRRIRLKEIRRRLKDGLPCRVVSTSLIEAGVDVDFPLAYREAAGLDSLLQTAGRCNREGKRSAENSFVYCFRLEETSPPRMLQQNVDAAEFVRRHFAQPDIPEAIQAYFQELYDNKGNAALDRKRILDAIRRGIDGCAFPFDQIAQQFRLIETPTRTVYLPVDEGIELCERLRSGKISRALLRRLGLYRVEIYHDRLEELIKAGTVEYLHDGFFILSDTAAYSRKTGLDLNPKAGDSFFF